jgi:mannosyltransferase OCH1-like enzyme
MNNNYIIIAFLLLIILCIIYYNKIKENLENKDNKDENNKNTVIPLHIYQTWHTNSLPKYMQECVDKLKERNPEFEYHFYNDDDCRNYIKDNFNKDVLHAFDKLKPGAFKADLWRYCILYKKGGIYLDIKYQCENNFKLIELTDKEYFVKDIPIYNRQGIYNALLVCKPENNILLNCINQIVENVKNKYYGNNPLEVTGPLLMSYYFNPLDVYKMELKHVIENGNYYIKRKDTKILKIYNQYRSEQKIYQKNKYYSALWHSRDIYE